MRDARSRQGMAMKRITRVSIVVEHRSVTFSLTGVADATARPGDAAGAGETDLEPVEPPPVCPQCGATWIPVTAVEGELAAPGLNAICRALEQHGLHVHVFGTNQLSICSKSLEAMEAIKESL